MKQELLFYNAYESFYSMAEKSKVFSDFCSQAFGKDFSQDGFSDISQVNKIFDYIPATEVLHILDIGCGNGKMLSYLQQKTNAFIYGFDYSNNAIRTEKERNIENSNFSVGVIGEVEYPPNSFDIVISMDTMYFAKDMCHFVSQIKHWLKPNGILYVAYQEGDIMPKTDNVNTTVFAQALKSNQMNYQSFDITRDVYVLLKKKRECAQNFMKQFEQECLSQWYKLLINQTACVCVPFEKYKKLNARYIYIAKLLE